MALVPLLERFEAEHGTLPSGAMFGGRSYNVFFACCPFEDADRTSDSSFYASSRGLSPCRTRDSTPKHTRTWSKVIRQNCGLQRSSLIPLSIWVFVLLGVEGIKAYKANPHLTWDPSTREDD